MRVVIDPAMVDELATAPAGWEDVALIRKATAVELLAKRFVNVDTGRLRGSIEVRLEETPEGRAAFVGSDLSYAIYQELDPGDIFPAEAGKYADMPRIRRGGQPYLRPALYGAE